MQEPRPDIHHIHREDLVSQERLAELYIEAVRRDYWPNTPAAALEFACLAEKALHDDKQNNPGALFVALLKRRDGSMVTQEVETRAMARFPSGLRQELVATAGELSRLPVIPVDEIQDALHAQNVGYAHAVMVQCFMPQHPIDARAYHTTHGRASLRIEAGGITNPNVLGQWTECAVPAGPKPRLILPYIVREAIRNESPEIDLGRSLRAFMARLGMPISGQNGKVLTVQVENIAAAHIMIGEWTDNAVRTVGGKLAKEFSFWLERDVDQHTMWTPTMTLSDEFFDAIQQHRVPIDMAHLAQLARSPRRMDLYVWLSYRTSRIAAHQTKMVSVRALHHIFGPDITRSADFSRKLRQDLQAIHSVYPHYRVAHDNGSDVLWLQRSPPPIPFTHKFSRRLT